MRSATVTLQAKRFVKYHLKGKWKAHPRGRWHREYQKQLNRALTPGRRISRFHSERGFSSWQILGEYIQSDDSVHPFVSSWQILGEHIQSDDYVHPFVIVTSVRNHGSRVPLNLSLLRNYKRVKKS